MLRSRVTLQATIFCRDLDILVELTADRRQTPNSLPVRCCPFLAVAWNGLFGSYAATSTVA